MNDEKGVQGWFFAGIGLFVALIVGGLVWAVMSSGGPTNVTVGEEEKNLAFTDTNDPATGAQTSSATVRIFGDFQCPACAAAEPGLSYARKTYGDRVKFIWDDFPLIQVHQNAMNGAVAARCAEAQGKFWEYHDILYQSQSAWSAMEDPKGLFVTYAKSVGANPDAFSACYDAADKSKITADMDEGTKNNVFSTPTFFINNRRYIGSLTNEQWDTEIKRALGAS